MNIFCRWSSTTVFFLLVAAAAPYLTGCAQATCSTCDFSRLYNGSNSNSNPGFGTFIFGAVPGQQMTAGQTITFMATVVADRTYNGQVGINISYPDIRALDPQGTITISANPPFVTLAPNGAANVQVTVITKASSPKMTSLFYVVASDITHNQTQPFTATVTVPLTIQ